MSHNPNTVKSQDEINPCNDGKVKNLKKITYGNLRHGLRHTRLYKIWQGLKKRCYNKNYHAYDYYGGKGVVVCEEWLNDVRNFYNWAINNGYRDDLSIDRIDGEGNYCPENCRWADTHLQGVNQKIQKNNKSGYKGARYNKTNNKYMADIKVCRKYHFLGYFNTLYEAVMARNNFIIQNNLSEYKIQEWKGEKRD